MEQEPLGELVGAVGPEIAKQGAFVGAALGVVGIAFGGAIGTIKRTTPVLFAIASGVQLGFLGFSWTILRQGALVLQAREDGVTVNELSQTERLAIGAAAGGSTGMLAAAAFRGRSNIIPGILCGGTYGVIHQYAESRYQGQPTRKKDDEPKMGIMERLANSGLNPMRKLSDEEYKQMLNEKQIKAEAEIALLDEQIAKLKAEANNDTSVRS